MQPLVRIQIGYRDVLLNMGQADRVLQLVNGSDYLSLEPKPEGGHRNVLHKNFAAKVDIVYEDESWVTEEQHAQEWQEHDEAAKLLEAAEEANTDAQLEEDQEYDAA